MSTLSTSIFDILVKRISSTTKFRQLLAPNFRLRRVHRFTQKDPKEPKRTQKEPKRTQKDPKGTQKEPKRTQKEHKRTQKEILMFVKCHNLQY